MYIIAKDGTERYIDDKLYAQAMQGRAALTESLGKEAADAIFAEIGVESEADLTDEGQNDIKREDRAARKSVVDVDEAVADAAGRDPVPTQAEAVAEAFSEGPLEEEDEEEDEGVFSKYELGEDGRIRTHEEADRAERAAYAASQKKALNRQRAARTGIMGYAVYRSSKWSPAKGLMLNDKGELVPEAPLETGSNRKYRMADPDNPDEAAYVRTTEDGKTLYRIQAMRDMTLADGTVVKAGEWGGWIESEANLSFEDDSWIKDDAVACEAARVSDGAVLKDEATAAGWSRITEESVVEGSSVVDERGVVAEGSTVSDSTVVTGFGQVTGQSEISGESEITGVAEVAAAIGEDGKDVQAGDPADAEAKLQEEAAMDPSEVLYGSTDGLDFEAYDHGGGAAAAPETVEQAPAAQEPAKAEPAVPEAVPKPERQEPAKQEPAKSERAMPSVRVQAAAPADRQMSR